MSRLFKYMSFATTALTYSCLITLGVVLWPGALSAVMGFSLLGYSLGILVGASIPHQIAAVAALAFAGLHVASLAVDAAFWAVGKAFSFLTGDCCSPDKSDDRDAPPPPPPPSSGNHNTAYRTMSSSMPSQASNGQPVKTVPAQQGTHTPLYPPVSGSASISSVDSVQQNPYPIVS